MHESDYKALLRWFGESRIVNVLGFPKVVYHSTSVPFSVFNTGVSEFGAHLGSIAQANSFGDWDKGQGRFILPLYARLENPLRLLDRGDFGVVEVAGQLADLGVINQGLMDDVFDSMDYCPEDDRPQRIAHWIALLQDAVIAAGFDGAVYLNRREGLSVPGKFISGEETHDWSDDFFLTRYPEASDSYIVFNPCHIKSALSNSGQYSLKTPSIFD